MRARYFYVLLLFAVLANLAHAQLPAADRLLALTDSASHWLERDLTKAKNFQAEAEILLRRNPNISVETRAQYAYNQGYIYVKMTKFDESQKYFNESISLYEKLKNQAGIAKAQTGLASVFMELKLLDKAEKSLLSAADALRATGNKAELANTLVTLAGVYFYAGRKDEIAATLTSALQMAQAARDTGQVIRIYTNRIQTFFKFKQPERVGSDIDSLEAISRKANSKNGMAQVYYYRGYMAKLAQNYTQANEYYTQSLAYFEQINNRYRQRDLHNAIAANAELIQDFQNALVHTTRAYAISDSIFSEQQAKTISELQVKYETEKKEAQLREQMANLELATLREQQALSDVREKELRLSAQNQQLEAANLRNKNTQAEIERDQAQIAQQKAALATARQRQLFLLIVFSIVAVLLALLARQFWATRRANQALAQSNARIETMLRELNHRVKNNLQVVSSLFRLQARRVSDSATANILREGQARVDAMSILHQQLYQNEGVTSIHLQNYLQTLLDQLRLAYGYADKPFSSRISVAPVETDVDKALPIGLIMNELITNSFKYAFAETAQPEITIHITPQRIEYRDNGCGLPDNFNPQQATSFGMRLINTFSQQLKGQASFQQNTGLLFVLTLGA